MTSSADVLDILQIEDQPKRVGISRDGLVKKNKVKKTYVPPKRPGNIPREVWQLRFDKHDLPPLMPSDQDQIYKQPRVQIGRGRARSWRWAPFINPARSDRLILHHWRRLTPTEMAAPDPSTLQLTPEETYDFARFNKHVDIPQYSEEEYKRHFQSSDWSREETDYLMNQCKRYDLRFIIIQDSWDAEKYPTRRSVEDIKARFYRIMEQLDVIRGTGFCQGFVYDGEHERRRKRQLALLMERTKEQVDEEANLMAELRRIEMHKKEREKKTQDLQRLISQAEQVIGSVRGAVVNSHHIMPHPQSTDALLQLVKTYVTDAAPSTSRVAGEKRPLNATQASSTQSASSAHSALAGSALDGLKFPEMKNPGVYLRSQRMKLPPNLGQRKQKMIESFLQFYHIDLHPVPTTEVVEAFNDLRNDILLLHELNEAVNLCDYELQSMRLKYMSLAPGKAKPSCLATSGNTSASQSLAAAVGSDILTALRAVDSRRTLKSSSSNLLSGGMAPPTLPTETPPPPASETSPSGSTGLASGSVPNGQTSSITPPLLATRKRRAAAVEQGNVMKQLLKNKGQLVDDS